MTDWKSPISQPATSARESYRHGDLSRALLAQGIELARAGGPDAVILREATRRVGVVPNAAYRHFASRMALLRAVQAAALSSLASAMESEWAKVTLAREGQPKAARKSKAEAAAYARGCVRAVGMGYLQFAQHETGLFRTAFLGSDPAPNDGDPAKAGPAGLNPFQLLGAALDELVAAGVLAAPRRVGAEYLAWSAVHGMALLMIDGPLRGASPEVKGALAQRVLDMVEGGLR